MTGQVEHIPLKVDVSRIIEVLASQIYQSPLALLRENTQNAFDAILLRAHRGDDFEAAIRVEITPSEIRISDNGVGMTYSEVQNNFWQAGSSSKNTPEARSAGVVGTFGIGAMANFGIASHLRVVTETADGAERTETRAEGATLSAQQDCIEMVSQIPLGEPGTEVIATVPDTSPVNVQEAVTYITEFVRHVDLPVEVNGQVVSQRPLDSQWPAPTTTLVDSETVSLSAGLSGTATLKADANAQLWVDVVDLTDAGQAIDGRIVLSQGGGQLHTFRSGFGLASVPASSVYNFGGAVNLQALQPTAGREALATASMEFVQQLVTTIETWASEHLGHSELADQNAQFIEWARRHNRADLCGQLTLRLRPGSGQITLAAVKDRTEKAPMPFYAGNDEEVIRAFATEDSPLLIGSQRNPRKACEQRFLDRYCRVEAVPGGPSLIEKFGPSARPIQELAVAHRVSDTLERDYFLPNHVTLGRISHGVPAIAIVGGSPVEIVLDPSAQSFKVLQELYTTEYTAFGSFAKDFVRTVVFPKVEELVPSSTREGAQAFLTKIRSKRDLFEYELTDRQELSAIWEDYYNGGISFDEAASRSRQATRGSVQVVSRSASVGDIAPDLVANQEQLPQGEVGQAAPAIPRPEVSTDASILTISDENVALNGFRCFLALSDRVLAEKGDFFLQPHRTSVVWGGQKVLFVFQHHSEEFGLYYDIQSDDLVASESGGGEFPTSTLLLGSRIFIPIPDPIRQSFIPATGSTKRLEVRGDVLHSRGR